ncbi:mitochondrial ribosomal death-associated protein 3-domain-containing protein [Melampsora americana]|nr:mitochondrial ribosomal death-associated protein 3-domain-containing protein [Melampsora americana]
MGGPDPGRLVNPEYITKKPIDLSSLPELVPTEFLPSNVGKSFKFTPHSLKAFERFSLPDSIAVDWKPTPTPTTTMRKASVEMISKLNKSISHKEGDPSVLTLTGKPGSGKSTVMLQAVSYAVQQNWIVLYIPDVKSLVNGQYAYEYCPKDQIYHQNSLSVSILNMLSSSNLGGINLDQEYQLFGMKDEKSIEASEPLTTGLPITNLIQMGINQPHFAPMILEIVFDLLSHQTLRPVLFALDGVQNLFRPTCYKDGNFQEIDSFVLNVPRALVRFARGSRKFKKGLTLISASSLDTTSKSLAWDLTAMKGEIPSGYIWPGWAAYGELVKPIYGFPKLEIGSLDREEAVGMALGLQLTKQILGPLSDRVFVRHLVSSSGNAREFRREIKFQTAL